MMLYAAQLGQGVGALRFAPLIETEFREDHYQRHVSRMRTGFGVAIGLYLMFLTLRLLTESGPAAQWGLLLRVIIIGTILATIVASYSLGRPGMTRLVVLTYLVFGAGVTAIECLAHHYQIDRRYEGLLFISVHCFVFSGLLFRTACLTALGIVLTYAYGGWFGGLLSKAWGYELFFLVLINMLGAVALYSMELADRENFLRRHMLGELTGEGRMTGLLGRAAHTQSSERLLTTVMFTDVVDSTARAAKLGDRAWKDLMAEHESLIRSQLRQFAGHEVETAGDGFVAIFDKPAQAIRCAQAIQQAVGRIGLALRIGIHTGEVEVSAQQIRGIAVHIAARINQLAEAGEVLVSRTVRDLVSGAGLHFAERGTHAFKGVPEPWQVFAVASI